MGGRPSYNGDTVIVNVCLVVKLLLELGVLLLRPGPPSVSTIVVGACFRQRHQYLLDTTRVQRRLIHAVGNHRAGESADE